MLRRVAGRRRWRLAAAVCAAGGAALGCGLWDADDPTQRSNASACTAYVAELNQSLTSCGLLYDPANMCSSANYPAVDMAPYYDCLVEHTVCERGVLQLDVEDCEPPLLVLAQTDGLEALPAGDEAALRSVEEGRR
jgi:hypothetical protein